MTNLSRPEVTNLLGTIRDLERRVMDLERANTLVGSVPKGQSIKVLDPNDGSVVAVIGQHSGATWTDKVGSIFYDAAGEPVAIFGQLPAGDDGAELNTNGFATLRVGSNGVDKPYEHIPFLVVPETRVNITSGTFTTTFRAYCINTQHKHFKVRVDVGADASTNGELRLSVPFTGQTSSVFTVTGTGSLTSKSCTMDVTGSPGGSISVEIQIRRTSGAGNVFVESPIINFGDHGSPTGAWS